MNVTATDKLPSVEVTTQKDSTVQDIMDFMLANGFNLNEFVISDSPRIVSLKYKEYAALLNQTTVSTTSGLLVVGKSYLIVTLVSGDVFTNVGYVSAGTPFTATGTTPTTWSNSTVVINRTNSAPVVTVLANGLSAAITWAYVSPGVFTGTLASAFTASKTITPGGLLQYNANDVWLKFVMTSSSVITVSTLDLTYAGVATAVVNHPVLIRVYR